MTDVLESGAIESQRVCNNSDPEQLATWMENISQRFGLVVPCSNSFLIVSDEKQDDVKGLTEVMAGLKNVLPGMHFQPKFALQKEVYRLYETSMKTLRSGISRVEGKESSKAQNDLRSLIEDSVQRGANDVHLILCDDDTQAKVYLRVDGGIETTPGLMAVDAARAIVGVIFDYDGAERTDVDFSMNRNASTSVNVAIKQGDKLVTVEVRAEYRSMTDRDKILILRILTGTKKYSNLAEIGVRPSQVKIFERMINQSFGLILISGPTGAGKSTLLNGVISCKPANKIFHTLENPIEAHHDDPLICQGLMSEDVQEDITRFMRYDLDGAMVGEMRLGKEVMAAMALSRTGHLVLSTIHATDALGIIDRLVQMGVSRAELAERNLLRLLTGQRLAPLLCPSCKVADPSKLAELVKLVDEKKKGELQKHPIYFESQQGCKKCNFRGRQGRTLLLETVIVDDSSREFIQKGDSLGWEKSLKQRGWKSMADQAWELVFEGKVDALTMDAEVPSFLMTNDQWEYSS